MLKNCHKHRKTNFIFGSRRKFQTRISVQIRNTRFTVDQLYWCKLVICMISHVCHNKVYFGLFRFSHTYLWSNCFSHLSRCFILPLTYCFHPSLWPHIQPHLSSPSCILSKLFSSTKPSYFAFPSYFIFLKSLIPVKHHIFLKLAFPIRTASSTLSNTPFSILYLTFFITS